MFKMTILFATLCALPAAHAAPTFKEALAAYRAFHPAPERLAWNDPKFIESLDADMAQAESNRRNVRLMQQSMFDLFAAEAREFNRVDLILAFISGGTVNGEKNLPQVAQLRDGLKILELTEMITARGPDFKYLTQGLMEDRTLTRSGDETLADLIGDAAGQRATDTALVLRVTRLANSLPANMKAARTSLILRMAKTPEFTEGEQELAIQNILDVLRLNDPDLTEAALTGLGRSRRPPVLPLLKDLAETRANSQAKRVGALSGLLFFPEREELLETARRILLEEPANVPLVNLAINLLRSNLRRTQRLHFGANTRLVQIVKELLAAPPSPVIELAAFDILAHFELSEIPALVLAKLNSKQYKDRAMAIERVNVSKVSSEDPALLERLQQIATGAESEQERLLAKGALVVRHKLKAECLAALGIPKKTLK